MNRGFLKGKKKQDCLMQVLKERGLGYKTEDNPFKAEEEWVKQYHTDVLKER